jgi:hypothetical protein
MQGNLFSGEDKAAEFLTFFTPLRRLSTLGQPLGATAALTTRTSAWAGVWIAVHRFKYGVM